MTIWYEKQEKTEVTGIPLNRCLPWDSSYRIFVILGNTVDTTVVHLGRGTFEA